MKNAYVPQRLPETMTPQEIGAHMAGLRVQFNLTPQEVSERLHIRPRYVNAIEEAKFELMPGKVYARGYIHTYAEFLGLDAEQVATLCFARDSAKPAAATAAAKPTIVPLPRSMPAQNLRPSPWRNYAILAVVLLFSVVVISQVFGGEDTVLVEESNVAPVPEAMLQTVRNLMMPTPENHACITVDSALGCLYADNVTRTLVRLDTQVPLFLSDLDVSALVVPLTEAKAEEADTPQDGEAKAPEETATEQHDD